MLLPIVYQLFSQLDAVALKVRQSCQRNRLDAIIYVATFRSPNTQITNSNELAKDELTNSLKAGEAKAFFRLNV